MPVFGNNTIVGFAPTPTAGGVCEGSPGTTPGVPVSSGFLQSSTVQINDSASVGPFLAHMAVYRDSGASKPGVLISQTLTGLVPFRFSGWFTLAHTSFAPITAGLIYWTILCTVPAITYQLWTRAGGRRTFGGVAAVPPGLFPNPWPNGSFDNFEYAIYSTYTLTGPATYTPTAACCSICF